MRTRVLRRVSWRDQELRTTRGELISTAGGAAGGAAGLCAVFNNGTVGAALTLDWACSAWHQFTLTDATTTVLGAPTNATSGGTYHLTVVQSATGTGLVMWPAGTLWPGGCAVMLSTTAAAKDAVSLKYDGTSYFAIWTRGFA
jgi:hypothetical protein